MQHIIPDLDRRPVPDDGARLVGSESELPPAILLNFIHGAAAYQCWRTDETVNSKLNPYCSEKYEKTLSLKLVSIEPSGSEETDTSNGNSDDPDWRAGMQTRWTK